MTVYRCTGCDYVYDEAKGAAREGFPVGTLLGPDTRRLVLPGLRGTRKARLRICASDDDACRNGARRSRTDNGGKEMSDYKLFVCVQCGFEYDEAKGWPEDGIAPGTRWDDIPEDWSCPDCGAAKSDFEMVEVARS